MVGGLLRWLGKRESTPYFTRSGAAIRVAICLREVGFRIEETTSWNGKTRLPSSFRGVVLVTGGSLPTDPYLDIVIRRSCQQITHYYFNTVGATILNSMDCASNVTPEVIQQWFVEIFADISDTLCFGWKALYHNNITAHPIWGRPKSKHQSKSKTKPTTISTRLAAMYFSNITEHIAEYYEPIATEAVLQKIRIKQRSQRHTSHPSPRVNKIQSYNSLHSNRFDFASWGPKI